MQKIYRVSKAFPIYKNKRESWLSSPRPTTPRKNEGAFPQILEQEIKKLIDK